MKRTKTHIAAILLIVSSLQTVTASTVTLSDDNRRVEVNNNHDNSTLLPSSPFADFIVSGQNTTIGLSSFSGSGSGYADSDIDFFIQESFFDVSFSVTGSVEFDLSGSIFSDDGAFGLAESRVRLLSGSELTAPPLFSLTSTSNSNHESEDFDFSVMLTKGDYRLLLFTDQTPGNTFANWEFTAQFSEDFSPVPVPAALWLFGSGLLGLMTIVRKKV